MSDCSYVIARPCPSHDKARVWLSPISEACAVWAKRTEYFHTNTFAITSVNYWPSFIACAVWAQRTEHFTRTYFPPIFSRQYYPANANCRGEITPTAVVYDVHTLYIHVWILPLSAKLVHIELLLTHKLTTVNLWLLIAAYEQSLICYRTRCKHSCIPGAYPRKHLLIPCPTNTIVGHILSIVSNKRAPCERSEPNIQSNKSANRCKD